VEAEMSHADGRTDMTN